MLKENAVSAIITDRIFETSEKAALAIKYNIPGLPIPIPVFFAFTLENTGSLREAEVPDPSENAFQDIRSHTPYHQFILGSSYGNFGFGLIIQNGRAYSESEARNQSILFEYDTPSSPIDARKRFDAYGFEFGYINASNPSEGYAVTMGFLYKKYGGTNSRRNRDTESGEYNNVYLNNLPLIDPGNNRVAGSVPTGGNRSEIQLDFLGFYHITSLLNVGGSLRISLPFASGYQVGIDNKTAPALGQNVIDEAKERDSVKLSGYYVNPVIFLDIDFPILDGERIVGYFRLSPALNYTNLEESVSRDIYTIDGTFDRKEQFYLNRDTFAVDLSVKLAVAMGANKEFEVYIGWTPGLIVYEKERTFLDLNDNKKFDESVEAEREGAAIIPWGTFKVREGSTGKYSAGMTYRPYKSLALHLNFLKEDQFINLSRVNIGVDYLF